MATGHWLIAGLLFLILGKVDESLWKIVWHLLSVVFNLIFITSVFLSKD